MNIDIVIPYILNEKELTILKQNSFENLKLFLRSVDKNLNFINNIFVVSNLNTLPYWLNAKRIKFIRYDQFIPKNFLTRCDSTIIQMFMYKIPDLSEYFIYTDVNTLFSNQTVESDWFVDNNPCLNIKTSSSNKNVKNILLKKKTEQILCKALHKSGVGFNKIIYNMQYATPMKRSSWQWIWDNCKQSIINAIHDKNISTDIVSMYQYLSNQYNEFKLEQDVFQISDIVTTNLNKQMQCNHIVKFTYVDFTYRIVKIINSVIKHSFNALCDYEQYDTKTNTVNPKLIRVALCAIAKNENLYIREWVEHYKQLGFEKIFLYDNNDIDGEHFEDVINDYIQNGFVEVIDKRGVEKGLVYDEQGINLQTQCYIECYEQKCNEFDWVAFFDIDEFLVLKNDTTLKQFLSSNKFNAFDTILMPWDHYDDNDLVYYDNRPVMERFTHKSNIKHYGVKSIARTNMQICDKTQMNLIHFFRINRGTAIITNGEIIDNTYYLNWITRKRSLSVAKAILNHYKTKTLEEFVNRHLGRHWGTTTQHTIKSRNYYDIIYDFFKYNSWNNEKAYFLHQNLQYNAIISLTSWKKRINTVYLTINNLKEMCGDKYKIVLTLSEDEFPNKENDLPQSLLDTNVEIIWVQRDYGCYKKVLFAMQKYPNIPIISADDDCLYKYNYADELYNKWLENPTKVITLFKENSYKINDTTYKFSYGRGTLFPPSSMLRLLPYIEDNEILERCNDDSLYGIYCNKENIKIIYLNHTYENVLCFSTNNDSLTYQLLQTNIKFVRKKFIEDKKIFVSKLLC